MKYQLGIVIVILLIVLYLLNVDTRSIVLSGAAIGVFVYLYNKHFIGGGG